MSTSRSLAAYYKIMGIVDNSIRQAESLLNDLRDTGVSAVESFSDTRTAATATKTITSSSRVSDAGTETNSMETRCQTAFSDGRPSAMYPRPQLSTHESSSSSDTSNVTHSFSEFPPAKIISISKMSRATECCNRDPIANEAHFSTSIALKRPSASCLDSQIKLDGYFDGAQLKTLTVNGERYFVRKLVSLLKKVVEKRHFYKTDGDFKMCLTIVFQYNSW
ncbi:hypothetical protein WR25_06264 [Diploscapter pachys]|uniref:Uncharacterized protein n=1 Tax=Diploscapter pachys TaxID=2018661 RepID=A0A2A2LXV0_9BILA|nr:hypothetical protein WR25_06264 [Diploscapter pachys]